MCESDRLGMEVEAGCLLAAIERVAKDRGIQSFLVGTMYTELVGTSCLGIESETEMLVVSFVFFVTKSIVFFVSHIRWLCISSVSDDLRIVPAADGRQTLFGQSP